MDDAGAAGSALGSVGASSVGEEGGGSEDGLSDAETELGEAPRLYYGSHDPHGVGDADRVPRPVCAQALLLGTREGASAEELLARPFAEANVAPVTSPIAPPLPQPSGAPVVTRRSQVVPQCTDRLVRQWCRQLRRCFRAARRGEVSLARRLRPDDLWLEHSEHSVPETAPWDWDLRPLECGEPAVPHPVSGRDGVLPATSVALSEVERAAVGFDDQAIVSEMLHGVADDSDCRRGTLLCAPHAGALANFAVALEKVAANVSQGWATGGHAELPCWPLRTCPFSVVDESVRAGKPKFRLTTDLSWPHPGALWAAGGAVDSVNDGMDRSRWPANRLVRAHEYAEAAAIHRGPTASPRRSRVWGLDAQGYYRVVGRQRRELWRNGIFLPDGVQLDGRCCFGDASAATKCARISNYLVFQIRRELERVDAEYPTRDPEWLVWLADRRAAALEAGLPVERFAVLHWLAMYIDDQMGSSADDLLFDVDGAPVLRADGQQMRRAQAHFEAARQVLERFGWRSAPAKEQSPALEVESLGVEISLVDGRLRLSEAKRLRYSAQAEAVAAAAACSTEDFAQLLGRLQFAVQCYPIGQQHVRAAWRASRARYRLAVGRVAISSAVRRDLQWWVAELKAEGHEGVPLAQSELPPVGAGTAAIYADASSELGFAAWAVRDGELLYVEDSWDEAERAGLIISEMELFASTVGLVALAPLLGQHVVSFTDNTVAMAAMRRMAAGSERMQRLVRRRTEWLYAQSTLEGVARITSRNNLWADWGSRGRIGEVVEQAELLGLATRRIEIPAEWRDTHGLLAPLVEPPGGG